MTIGEVVCQQSVLEPLLRALGGEDGSGSTPPLEPQPLPLLTLHVPLPPAPRITAAPLAPMDLGGTIVHPPRPPRAAPTVVYTQRFTPALLAEFLVDAGRVRRGGGGGAGQGEGSGSSGSGSSSGGAAPAVAASDDTHSDGHRDGTAAAARPASARAPPPPPALARLLPRLALHAPALAPLLAALRADLLTAHEAYAGERRGLVAELATARCACAQAELEARLRACAPRAGAGEARLRAPRERQLIEHQSRLERALARCSEGLR